MTKNTITILLIEDDPEQAELIQVMLTAIRWFVPRVIHLDNLAAGIEYLVEHSSEEKKVDVVLLDLHLPDSIGFDTFHQLSLHVPWAPVILMTNLENEELALQAIREGAQDYLVKTELDRNLLGRAIRYAIERKRAEEALRESKERYMLAILGANDGLWDWDLSTNQIYFSPRWKHMLGYKDAEITDQPEEWLHRIHPDDRENIHLAILSHLNGMSPHFEEQYRIRCKNDNYIWVLTRGLAVRDEHGKSYRMAGSQTDVTIQKQTEQQLLRDAFYDSLTGLPNRALFMDRLKRALDHSRRYRDYRFAVLFLDLDRFKVVNDSLGHAFGDQVLINTARLLASCMRAGDTVARLGGDEFVILLEEIYDASDALLISERILKTLQTPFQYDQLSVVSSASVGIVLSDLEYERAEDILRDADIAMYNAKMRGKACHVVFDPIMRKRAVARMELENDLRQVLTSPERRQKELAVVFQPIVSAGTERIVGFEALLRWTHPRRGPIKPTEVIPVAEETDLIHPLGLWVLEQACRQVRIWQEQNPQSPGARPVTVNVNMSGKQFSNPDIVAQIQKILRETGVEPGSLSLEITETFLMGSEEPFHEVLEEIRRLGINLQVDDFGRGYSSLSYLQRFPVTTLKIDSFFTRWLSTEGKNAEIVRTILTLAKSLGMSVVAEGVETDLQLQKLKEMDCPYVQGFYISEPLNAAEAGELLAFNWQRN